MSKIKVGVIGAGGISSGVHLPLLSCINNVSIEFIADTVNPEILAKTYNTRAIKINDISSLPNCDAVLLAIPVGVKEKYIREFSKRNTYIFTEKPFTVDLETHKNFLKLSNKISCNYMRIYYNSTRQIKNIISSGIFGPIKKVSITEGGIIGKTGRSKNSYQADPKLSGGGMLMETSCHTFSQLAFLFNDISVREAKVTWEDGFDVESNATFDISDNTQFSIDYTATMLKPIENNATFFFEHNKIEFNHLIPNSIFTISSSDSEKQFIIEHEECFASTFAQAYYLKWKDFLNKISTDSVFDTELETSIMTTKMIADIIQKGSKK